MPSTGRTLGILAVLAIGCAQPIQLLERGVGGGAAPCSFWPPPPATSTWTGEVEGRTFGEVASRVGDALRDAGYAEQQWFPVGAGYIHGFALTTRLERINDDGTPESRSERWSALYSEAANLRWLERAHEMTLPAPGRYRVFLLAFTDLPIDPSGRAPAWIQDTLMEADTPPPLPSQRPAPASYHLAFYVYEYQSNRRDGGGAFLPKPSLPARAHLQRSKLSPLLAQ